MQTLLIVLILAASPDAARLAEEGAAFVNAGNVEQGRARLENAHELDPENATILFNLAQVRETAGDDAAAIKAYEEYLVVSPAASDVDEVLGHISKLQARKEAVPQAAKDHTIKGQAFFRMERLAEAESEFKEAEKLAPHWAAPQYNLAVLYETQGRTADALKRYRRYLPQASPEEEPKIREKIAMLQIQQKDRSRAQAASEAVPSNVALQAAPPKLSDSVSTTPPPHERQRIKFSVLDEGDRLDLQIETPNGIAKCDKSITFVQPCELVDLPAGPARVVVSGSVNFSKNVAVPVGPASARVGKSGHGWGWASLATGTVGIGLMVPPLAGVFGHPLFQHDITPGAAVFLLGAASAYLSLMFGIFELSEDHKIVEFSKEAVENPR
jgi:tetratricopeptide (TPR) repeat protein